MAIILEELGVAYETKDPGMDAIKKKPYIDVNPNGRLPAIEDPNTGITLWESGAIVQYLVETYDKKEVLTYTTVPEKYQLNQSSCSRCRVKVRTSARRPGSRTSTMKNSRARRRGT